MISARDFSGNIRRIGELFDQPSVVRNFAKRLVRSSAARTARTFALPNGWTSRIIARLSSSFPNSEPRPDAERNEPDEMARFGEADHVLSGHREVARSRRQALARFRLETSRRTGRWFPPNHRRPIQSRRNRTRSLPGPRFQTVPSRARALRGFRVGAAAPPTARHDATRRTRPEIAIA